VRKQAATRHGLLLEAPMELRYTYPPPSSATAAGGGAAGGLGGGVGVGVGGGGGGGGGGAALPTASGDNQPTGGALHKDTSLRALVEGGGGLRVTLLTLRCGFTPAWSPEETYRRYCAKDGLAPREAVAGALARDAVERQGNPNPNH